MRLVVATARRRSTRRSISGSSTRDSTHTQTPSSDEPAADQRRACAAEPQPQSLASVTASRMRGERRREERGAEPVDPRALRGGRRRHQPVRGQRGGQRDQADPEQPRDVERVDDHARQRQPDAAADAEDRADEPEPAGHALRRERVADDPEGEREDAAGHALDHAAGDQHADRVRQRAHDAAEPRRRAARA